MAVIIRPGATNTNKATVLWDNVFRGGILANILGTSNDHPPINAISDDATWSKWEKSSATTSTRFDIDLGDEVAIDCVGVSAHNLSTAGSEFRVDRSDDGVNFSSIFPYVDPDGDNDFMVIFPEVSARHYRIWFRASPDSSWPVAFIGNIFAGKRLVFPHAPVDSYTPLHHARRYEKLYNDSIKGHFLSNRVMSAGAETEVDMGFLDRGWLENNIRGFESHYNQGGTFFYCSSPSKYPDDMGYCRSRGSDESLDIEFIEGDKLASLSFGVRSYVGS